MQSLVTRTAGVAIRCIACDPKGKKMAVASECVRLHVLYGLALYPVFIHDFFLHSETTIRIIDIEDPLKIQILQGHKRGVRNVSWHPSEDLLVRINTSQAFLPFG